MGTAQTEELRPFLCGCKRARRRRDRAYRNRGLHRDVCHLGRSAGDMTERRPPYQIIEGQSAEVRLTVDFRR